MSGIAPARQAAYAILRSVNTGRLDLPEAAARARGRLADERDRALAFEIAAGTLRWMGALDAVLGAFAGREPARLDAEVLDILRLGAYQLLHLQRVPPPAVVHDSVELAKAGGKGSAAGLVNAVLRRVDREREALPLPRRPAGASAPEESLLDYLSVTLSHPRWLARRLLSRVGFEAAEAWLAFNNQPAPLTLRANTLRVERSELAARLLEHGVETRPARFASSGLVVTSGHPMRTPLADLGLFIVQDEASQLVAAFASASPGDRVLDACAAPGGKTLVMAGDMKGDGLLVAAELRPRRLKLLADTLRQNAVRNAVVVRSDAAAAPPFIDAFDLVLLDAPCSGLGTVRRDPEIRWRRSEPDLERLAAQQLRMLNAAAAAVSTGGRLVYATCSSEPDENEAVVSSFLSGNPGFSRVTDCWRGDPRLVDASGCFRTAPHLHDLEAFFAAMLRRKAGRGFVKPIAV